METRLYGVRHLAENTFLHLKKWRRLATWQTKTLAAFADAVQILCIALVAETFSITRVDTI